MLKANDELILRIHISYPLTESIDTISSVESSSAEVTVSINKHI